VRLKNRFVIVFGVNAIIAVIMAKGSRMMIVMISQRFAMMSRCVEGFEFLKFNRGDFLNLIYCFGYYSVANEY
jgi:hypothetical protein